MRCFKALLILGVCVLSLPTSGLAQVANASLRGNVYDQSSALIPSVSMSLRSLGEGAVLTVTSGSDGGYVFPNLIRGCTSSGSVPRVSGSMCNQASNLVSMNPRTWT